MLRLGLVAAVAVGCMALMGGSASANVATSGLTKMKVGAESAITQEVRHRRRCRRVCKWVGPVKVCKRKCRRRHHRH